MASKKVDRVVERLSSMSKEELESRELSVLEKLLINNSHDPTVGVGFALDMMLAGIDTVSLRCAHWCACAAARLCVTQADVS